MTDSTVPPADTPVTELNATESAERLVAMSAAFKASQPAPGPWGLSAEDANKQLAEMSDAFRKANKPANSPADTAVLGDATPPADVEVVSWPGISVRNKLSMIEELRSTGIPDQGIKRFISGEPYSREDFEAAQRWKQRAEADPELRAKILSGSAEGKHWLVAMSIITAMGPPAAK